MDFTYDDEQDALRDAVRGLIGKAYSDYEKRRQTTKEEPGFDEKVWTQLAEMGLLGLPFSEADGGVGAGPVEIGIVCQELGRVIAPEPYLELGRARRRARVRRRHAGAAPGAPRRPLGRRQRARLRPRRARRALVRLGLGRHRDRRGRRVDPQRHQGRRSCTAPAPTCSSSAPPCPTAAPACSW